MFKEYSYYQRIIYLRFLEILIDEIQLKIASGSRAPLTRKNLWMVNRSIPLVVYICVRKYGRKVQDAKFIHGPNPV